ncbi:reverse transcriptase [Caerostris extrusa]|uniref:Reverse transcriptase n=1 Tax=Caerostris extrusa TaxID=172846 RepID=A0AAV4XM52_CAEEX|nr:reverse transcriptase [Caerostris extrusa]
MGDDYPEIELLIGSNIYGQIPTGYGKRDSWSLHIFCDASKNAYATVIFFKSESSGQVYVKFVAAKSRISPLKKVTIPRLELLACVFRFTPAKYVVTALSLKEVPTYYWTDATVALCWIQREENWRVFVNNRVKDIRSLSKKEYWRHIPGKLNPADIASRGCTSNICRSTVGGRVLNFFESLPGGVAKVLAKRKLIAAEMKRK